MRLSIPYRCVLVAGVTLPLAACLATTGADSDSGYYARMRGTVTRADGAPVARAPIGISCVGRDAEPFGFTTDADASGRFEMDLSVPSAIVPLEGVIYMCRVLTPYTGATQAEKTVVTRFGSDRSTRLVTEVDLVVP